MMIIYSRHQTLKFRVKLLLAEKSKFHRKILAFFMFLDSPLEAESFFQSGVVVCIDKVTMQTTKDLKINIDVWNSLCLLIFFVPPMSRINKTLYFPETNKNHALRELFFPPSQSFLHGKSSLEKRKFHRNIVDVNARCQEIHAFTQKTISSLVLSPLPCNFQFQSHQKSNSRELRSSRRKKKN